MEKTWEDLCAQMLTIRQIFLYLDRSYVIAASGVRSLFEMGLQLFRTHLAAHPEVMGSQPRHESGYSLIPSAKVKRLCDGCGRPFLSMSAMVKYLRMTKIDAESSCAW